MIELFTQRLHLRQITHADWPLFLRLHQDDTVLQYLFEQPSVEEIQARFRILVPTWQGRLNQWLCLVVYEKQRQVSLGTMAFKLRPDTTAELGYMFLPEYGGNGYATEAMQAIMQYAVSLGISQFEATVTDGNIASNRVLEKNGFVLRKRIPEAYQIKNVMYDDLIFCYPSSDFE